MGFIFALIFPAMNYKKGDEMKISGRHTAEKIITAALVSALIAAPAACHAGDENPGTAAPPTPASSPTGPQEADGSTMERAIVIVANNEIQGIGAETIWVRQRHPDWKKIRQALLTSKNGKFYDKIDYSTPEGPEATLYFDITGFFGKM